MILHHRIFQARMRSWEHACIVQATRAVADTGFFPITTAAVLQYVGHASAPSRDHARAIDQGA
jgi:hypothetical protein